MKTEVSFVLRFLSQLCEHLPVILELRRSQTHPNWRVQIELGDVAPGCMATLVVMGAIGTDPTRLVRLDLRQMGPPTINLYTFNRTGRVLVTQQNIRFFGPSGGDLTPWLGTSVVAELGGLIADWTLGVAGAGDLYNTEHLTFSAVEETTQPPH